MTTLVCGLEAAAQMQTGRLEAAATDEREQLPASSTCSSGPLIGCLSARKLVAETCLSCRVVSRAGRKEGESEIRDEVRSD
jgi:hypothetical protein